MKILRMKIALFHTDRQTGRLTSQRLVDFRSSLRKGLKNAQNGKFESPYNKYRFNKIYKIYKYIFIFQVKFS